VTAVEPLRVDRSVQLSDAEIVCAVRAGDIALYEILMRRHNQTLYRAVRSILRDESEVEDVLQDAYIAAYRHLSEFEGRARFSTWLVQIGVNKALDLRRRRARVVALDPEAEAQLADGEQASGGPPTGDDPERGSARRELARVLERAIDALPDSFREVYVLRDIEGWSTQETGASLQLELATVKTRLHRARLLLRERLAQDFDAAGLSAFPFGAERCDRVVAAVLGRIAAAMAR
jgi:RNA polymerase sigma-70 factor (ECF subfamily)